jgi:hypothetical protein
MPIGQHQLLLFTVTTIIAMISPGPAEPKTLRYRILHTAARLARSGRRRRE